MERLVKSVLLHAPYGYLTVGISAFLLALLAAVLGAHRARRRRAPIPVFHPQVPHHATAVDDLLRDVAAADLRHRAERAEEERLRLQRAASRRTTQDL